MSRAFVLPDLGEGLVEAEIRAVLVHEGDVVKEDSPLLEVETDKAQVEIPSPYGGKVEKIHVTQGRPSGGPGARHLADGAGGATASRPPPPSQPQLPPRRLPRPATARWQRPGTGDAVDAQARARAGRGPSGRGRHGPRRAHHR